MTNTGNQPWWKTALRSALLQWAAIAGLLIPVGLSLYESRQAQTMAREALSKAYDIDRISKVQESGRVLDLALAHYFQSLSDLGLAEHGIRPSGAEVLELSKAQAELVSARKKAREAIMVHASDVQGLRGVVDQNDSKQYFAALNRLNALIDDRDIRDTGRNISAFGKLVKQRNVMLDKALVSVKG